MNIKILIAFAAGAATGSGVAYYIANKRAEAKWQAISEEEIAQVKLRYGAVRKEDYIFPEETEDEPTAGERLISTIQAEQNRLLMELGYSEDQIQDYRAGVPDADLSDVESDPTFLKKLAESSIVAEVKEIVQDKIESETLASDDELHDFAESDDGYPEPERKNIFDRDESDQAGFPISSDHDHYRAIEADRLAGKPYIMSVDEFMEDDSYEKISITYYEGDDVLADERDMPIDDEDSIVGRDNLERFGWESKDKNTVYVRNDKMEIFWEIARSEQAYTDMVAGMPQSKSPIGKFRTDD